MMEAVYLFSGLIIFSIVGIAILSYQDWQYKKKHAKRKNK